MNVWLWVVGALGGCAVPAECGEGSDCIDTGDCEERNQNSCSGRCAPVYGDACDDGTETYVGCVDFVEEAVCDDIQWTCAPEGDPEGFVQLSCRHPDGDGWLGGCPVAASPGGPECPEQGS